MNTKSTLTMAALIAASIAINLVFAHGDEDHEGGAAKHEGHAAALGKPGDPSKVSRTIDVTMSDAMRFTPSAIAVKRGETIRFALKNVGKLKHEMVLGEIKELKEHAALMQKFPEMEHSDPNMVTVAPGKNGEIIWQFTKAGTFTFACLQPGHFEAGMVGKVKVSGAMPAAVVASVDMNADAMDQKPKPMNTSKANMAATVMTDGEVKKIDKDTGKITIKHGPITNLGMPGMTMVFKAKDAAMLDQVKPGDKIRFVAERGDGVLFVTKIEAAQ